MPAGEEASGGVSDSSCKGPELLPKHAPLVEVAEEASSSKCYSKDLGDAAAARVDGEFGRGASIRDDGVREVGGLDRKKRRLHGGPLPSSAALDRGRENASAGDERDAKLDGDSAPPTAVRGLAELLKTTRKQPGAAQAVEASAAGGIFSQFRNSTPAVPVSGQRGRKPFAKDQPSSASSTGESGGRSKATGFSEGLREAPAPAALVLSKGFPAPSKRKAGGRLGGKKEPKDGEGGAESAPPRAMRSRKKKSQDTFAGGVPLMLRMPSDSSELASSSQRIRKRLLVVEEQIRQLLKERWALVDALWERTSLHAKRHPPDNPQEAAGEGAVSSVSLQAELDSVAQMLEPILAKLQKMITPEAEDLLSAALLTRQMNEAYTLLSDLNFQSALHPTNLLNERSLPSRKRCGATAPSEGSEKTPVATAVVAVSEAQQPCGGRRPLDGGESSADSIRAETESQAASSPSVVRSEGESATERLTLCQRVFPSGCLANFDAWLARLMNRGVENPRPPPPSTADAEEPSEKEKKKDGEREAALEQCAERGEESSASRGGAEGAPVFQRETEEGSRAWERKSSSSFPKRRRVPSMGVLLCAADSQTEEEYVAVEAGVEAVSAASPLQRRSLPGPSEQGAPEPQDRSASGASPAASASPAEVSDVHFGRKALSEDAESAAPVDTGGSGSLPEAASSFVLKCVQNGIDAYWLSAAPASFEQIFPYPREQLQFVLNQSLGDLEAALTRLRRQRVFVQEKLQKENSLVPSLSLLRNMAESLAFLDDFMEACIRCRSLECVGCRLKTQRSRVEETETPRPPREARAEEGETRSPIAVEDTESSSRNGDGEDVPLEKSGADSVLLSSSLDCELLEDCQLRQQQEEQSAVGALDEAQDGCVFVCTQRLDATEKAPATEWVSLSSEENSQLPSTARETAEREHAAESEAFAVATRWLPPDVAERVASAKTAPVSSRRNCEEERRSAAAPKTALCEDGEAKAKEEREHPQTPCKRSLCPSREGEPGEDSAASEPGETSILQRIDWQAMNAEALRPWMDFFGLKTGSTVSVRFQRAKLQMISQFLVEGRISDAAHPQTAARPQTLKEGESSLSEEPVSSQNASALGGCTSQDARQSATERPQTELRANKGEEEALRIEGEAAAPSAFGFSEDSETQQKPQRQHRPPVASAAEMREAIRSSLCLYTRLLAFEPVQLSEIEETLKGRGLVFTRQSLKQFLREEEVPLAHAWRNKGGLLQS